MAGPGHNSQVSKEQLRSIVERVERLEEEKKSLADDIRDVYGEAKNNGFDVKALRAVIRLRKQDAAERAEHEAILETYLHALGMLADTPLGQSGLRRAVEAFGTPVELTEDERAKGYTAAFVDKKGHRVAMGAKTN